MMLLNLLNRPFSMTGNWIYDRAIVILGSFLSNPSRNYRRINRMFSTWTACEDFSAFAMDPWISTNSVKLESWKLQSSTFYTRKRCLGRCYQSQTTQTRTYKKRKLPDLVFLKGTGSQKRRTRMDAPFVKGLKLSVDLKIRRLNEQPSLYQDIPDSVAVDLMRPFAPQSTYINPSLNQNSLTFFRSSLGAFLYNRFPPFVQSIF